MSQEAKENTERIKIICWTGHKRKKRELDKRQEKRWVRTTSVSMAGLPTPTDTVGIYDPGLMPSIRDISPDTEPVRDFLLEQGKQKDTQLRELRFRFTPQRRHLMAQTQGFTSCVFLCKSRVCPGLGVTRRSQSLASLFPRFQNLNETAQKPKQDPKTTNTSAECLSPLTELETKTTYETCFTWLGCLRS